MDITTLNREMLKDEKKWPQWPFLPLKRGEFLNAELGVLISGRGPVVFRVNLFEVAEKIASCETHSYPCMDDVVLDGWSVD